MNMKKSVFPVMITPYKNGNVDFENVRNIANWYIDNGCDGIFAVCQSSEMLCLTLDEKVNIAKEVVKAARGRIMVVASGHTSDDLYDQAEEINAIAKTGVDAVILSTNRLDLNNEGDDVWINNLKKLLELVDKDIKLGLYECPVPYKKLLTKKMLDYVISTGRFKFIKDTCCKPEIIKDRIKQLEGTGIELYNANGQTLYQSLIDGAKGYAGVIANFCPNLIVKLCNNFEKKEYEELSDMVSLLSFTENDFYPITAKYYLQLIGFDITLETRTKDVSKFDEYQMNFVRQMKRVIEELNKKWK